MTEEQKLKIKPPLRHKIIIWIQKGMQNMVVLLLA